LEVFESKRYATSTIEDVVTAANVSRSTFYLHFHSKLDLVIALRDSLAPEQQQLYAAADNLVGASRVEVRRWLEQWLDFYRRHKVLLEVVIQALAVEPDLAREYFDLMNGRIRGMTGYVSHYDGEEREAAQLRIALLIVQLERFSYLWLAREMFSYQADDVLDLWSDTWWRTLSGDQAAASHEPGGASIHAHYERRGVAGQRHNGRDDVG
jgi:AcrR family transcriptional regulator